MRNLIIEGLLLRPLTETPPSLGCADLEALCADISDAARRKLGRSLSIRAVDAGSCNGLRARRFTRSITPSTTSNVSVCASSPRRVTPMFSW